ncbi:MAG: hypothetical protein WA639_08420 [Candidatus Acidiferrum sp.]
MTLLRKELDPRTGYVLLVTLFYVGPFILIGVCPPNWETFKVGFTAGLSPSMCMALFLLIAMHSIGFPSPSTVAPWVYVFAFVVNFSLFLVAIGFWSFSRKRIANHVVVKFFLLGLVYPYLAFAVIAFFPFVR